VALSSCTGSGSNGGLVLATRDDEWRLWITLVVNPVIYAEMSLSLSTLEVVDDVVLSMDLGLREIPRPAIFLAAKAYAQYRRRGGSKGQVLPDFFVEAYAAVEGWPLLTRDASRFETYFPALDVIAPRVGS
jgi:predicted nucleic acid-binding protein